MRCWWRIRWRWPTPWHSVLSYTRSRDQDLLEFVCAENDRNPVDAAGHTGLE